MKRFTALLMALVMAVLAGQTLNARTGVKYTTAASEFTVETNADAQQVKLRLYKEGIGGKAVKTNPNSKNIEYVTNWR